MSRLNIKQNTKDQSAIFFGICDAWTTWNIHIDTQIQILYKALRRLKNNVMCFFYTHHFCKKHQAEVWSKIITILSIKRIQKNKYSKWKTCWVKSIHSLLLQNIDIKNERHWLSPTSIQGDHRNQKAICQPFWAKTSVFPTFFG